MFCEALALIALSGLFGCEADTQPQDTRVRGLKTFLVEEPESNEIRRFPSVLEPSELNTLSFELGGRLGEMNISVGQIVSQGEVIASIDPESLETRVANANAGVDQAQAAAENAANTLRRQEQLFERGTTTQAALDNARTEARTRDASLAQARRALEIAQQDLTRATLRAPFEGIINSVEVDSFATVNSGQAIATLYRPDQFEVSFTAGFDVIDRIVVGQPAKLRLAVRPEIELDAVVSELGSRAGSVSSFPVVLKVTSHDPVMKAGLAVEASIDLPIQADEGYVLPLSAVIMEDQFETDNGTAARWPIEVYVYDADSSTVSRRTVSAGGIRDNDIVVVDGLSPGDRVASAGVAFLRDGQTVKLLDTAQ